MACLHANGATLACSACGIYRRGCQDCGICYECLRKNLMPRVAAVVATEAAAPLLLECSRCLVVRRRPGQGLCDSCGGRPAGPGLAPAEVHAADLVKPPGPAEPGMAGLG